MSIKLKCAAVLQITAGCTAPCYITVSVQIVPCYDPRNTKLNSMTPPPPFNRYFWTVKVEGVILLGCSWADLEGDLGGCAAPLFQIFERIRLLPIVFRVVLYYHPKDVYVLWVWVWGDVKAK